MEFIEDAGDQPWCMHLSYIKPHWPYIAPQPYHDMYGPEDVQPVKRRESERESPHPILKAYFEHRFSRVFTRDEVRSRVIPVYMGLIAQIDDQIGRLMAWLDAKDLTEDTLIVFTSDHGDYLGDHWLGEKELFHDASARVPLIVVDPSGEADATRSEVNTELVEAIDLLPTFVEWFGGEPKPEILEGRSLLPLLHGQDVSWRDVAISEYDYSGRRARKILGQPVSDCRLTMLFDGRWKYIHAEGFCPMLYDLENDPDEYFDLGRDPSCAAIVHRLNERMGKWNRQHHNRTTISDKAIETRKGGELAKGIILGFWNEDELAEARKDGESGN
jgi:arylsulfatase A-like enzyme